MPIKANVVENILVVLAAYIGDVERGNGVFLTEINYKQIYMRRFYIRDTIRVKPDDCNIIKRKNHRENFTLHLIGK